MKKYFQKNKKSEAGFTLVEVMVTMVIIGLLTTFVVMNILPAQDEGRAIKAKADITALENALAQYYLDMSVFPDEDEGLEALVKVPAGHPKSAFYRRGGYIKLVPLDPWQGEYVYVNPGEHGLFDIYSYGSDGQPGGEGTAADIVSWKQ